MEMDSTPIITPLSECGISAVDPPEPPISGAGSDHTKAPFHQRYKNNRDLLPLIAFVGSEGGQGFDLVLNHFYTFYSDSVVEENPLARYIRDTGDMIYEFIFDDFYPLFGCKSSDFVYKQIWLFIEAFCSHLEGYVPDDGAIWLRYNAGLLRQGQVRLIRWAVVGYLREMRGLIGTLDPGNVQSTLMLMWYSSDRLEEMNDRLLSSPRFRSERLEVLLLVYLEEPGVDMEVARGILECDLAEYFVVNEGWSQRRRDNALQIVRREWERRQKLKGKD
ncbi:hypothetical protein BJ508DRAFT_418504 [Ascobolus immersus RN42]|uniref:Uncharacterized protein n=1 Tax=Ascobolus immersus RN42 TaxID=1160509 RepID=A0A3N4HS72_ASCIM|nr:hypothetical protein BJ508DRAFT_418504 [Ascobolus immersus RN42]